MQCRLEVVYHFVIGHIVTLKRCAYLLHKSIHVPLSEDLPGSFSTSFIAMTTDGVTTRGWLTDFSLGYFTPGRQDVFDLSTPLKLDAALEVLNVGFEAV